MPSSSDEPGDRQGLPAQIEPMPKPHGELESRPAQSYIADPWASLRSMTPARIALGRSGGSLPTVELLQFQHDHALAREAVWRPFDPVSLERELLSAQLPGICVVHVDSAAKDRQQFLQRPDLGRRLDDESATRLSEFAFALQTSGTKLAEIVWIISDGLSADAAHRHAVPLMAEFWQARGTPSNSVVPVVIARHGRVAIQDEIGARLSARAAVILLGERPGLGAPDSLGAYLVYDPKPGRTDAERNCISNIRPQGLCAKSAAMQLVQLSHAMFEQKGSGISLRMGQSPYNLEAGDSS